MFGKPCVTVTLALLAPLACSEDLPTSGTDLGLQLDVTFQTTASHIHVWETPVPYSALIKTTSGGTIVTNFDTMRVEYAAVGSSKWAKLGDLRLRPTGSFVDTLYWPNAGDFNFRLVGHRPAQNGVQVLNAPTAAVSPVRQHYNVSGTTWRVEFEPTPGINKSGDTPTMNFYIMQQAADANGNRAPIGGLTGLTVTCTSPANAGTTKALTEKAGTPGLYQATCAVGTDGWWKATINFPNPVVSQDAAFGVGKIS